MHSIAIRKETKSKWERRTPLNPDAVQQLTSQGVKVAVEESPVRIYSAEQYQQAGASIVPNTDDSTIVAGIKEPLVECIRPGQIYLGFAHVIKGQPYNMQLLRTFLERRASLIDYEPIVDDKGTRIAACFSRFAGMSGTVETLRVAAQKIAQKGKPSVLTSLKQPWQYGRLSSLEEAARALAPLKEPLRILIVGNGNVGIGCKTVLDFLGVPQLAASKLDEATVPAGPWYSIVDAPETVRAKDGRPFDFKTYLEKGSELFESTFERFLGKFDMLLQGAYWDERYPRQLPLDLVKRRADDLPWIVGDISCDLDGTLEFTTKATSIDDPAFTYNVAKMQTEDKISWDGPTVMSIDNLPCELAADVSDEFSKLLVERLPYVLKMDLTKPFEHCGLSTELQRGTIVYNGELTPKFKYLERYL